MTSNNNLPNTALNCAVLGPSHSYHALTAKKLFGRIELMACQSFSEIVDAVATNQATFGVVAVNNSSIGPITDGKTAIKTAVEANKIVVTGQYKLPIEHALIGTTKSRFNKINRVISHPAALAQCQQIITNHGWQAVEAASTTKAVEQLAAHQNPTVAAIASPAAGAKPGLKILKAAIQDQVDNHTTFKIIVATSNLNQYRQLLDQVDAELVQILSTRQQIITAVADYKRQAELPTHDANREEQLLKSRLAQAESLALNPHYIRKIFQLILQQSKQTQEEK